jgi:sugar-specific transcriptional regulator TrmB
MTVKNQPELQSKQKKIKDQPNPLIKKLIDFGLSEAESSIYVYLLHIGREIGGSKIALGIRMHRQYVYIALPKLIDSGLVEQIKIGKQSKYKARSPSEVEKLGRKRALEAGDLARELNLMSNIGNEQDFEVLQGKKAIQEYEMQYAIRTDVGSEECILGGASEYFSDVMEDNLPEYLEIKTKKKIGVKYIGTLDEEDSYLKYVGMYDNQEYRFMYKLPKGKTHMVIRKDSVSFFSFLNPPLVYVIKSPVIAENYKQFFMMLWEMAGE